MDIIKKFIRLFSRNLHVVTEQHGATDFIYRQALRKMEEELEQKVARLQEKMICRERVQRDHETCCKAYDKLEEDLSLAEKKHQARLISNQLGQLLNHRDEIAHHIDTLDREIKQIEDSIKDKQTEYELFIIKARQYFCKGEIPLPGKADSSIMQQITLSVL